MRKTKQDLKTRDDDKGRAEFLRTAHGGGGMDRGGIGSNRSNRIDRAHHHRPRQGNGSYDSYHNRSYYSEAPRPDQRTTWTSSSSSNVVTTNPSSSNSAADGYIWNGASSNSWATASSSSSNGWAPFHHPTNNGWNAGADAYRQQPSGHPQREKRHTQIIQPDCTQEQRQKQLQLETQKQRRKQAQEEDIPQQGRQPPVMTGGQVEDRNPGYQGNQRAAPRHQGERSTEQVQQSKAAQEKRQMGPLLETQRQRRGQAQEDILQQGQHTPPVVVIGVLVEDLNQGYQGYQGERSTEQGQQTEAQGAYLNQPTDGALGTPSSTSFPSTSFRTSDHHHHPHHHPHPCATTTSPMIIDDDVKLNDHVPASTILQDVYKRAEKNLNQEEEEEKEKSCSNSTRDTSSIMGGSEDRATIGEEDKASEDSRNRRRSSVKRPMEAELTVTRTRPRVHSNNMGDVIPSSTPTGDSSSSTTLMHTDANTPGRDVIYTQRGNENNNDNDNNVNNNDNDMLPKNDDDDGDDVARVLPVMCAPLCMNTGMVLASATATETATATAKATATTTATATATTTTATVTPSTTSQPVKPGAFKPPPPKRAGVGAFKAPPPPRVKGPPTSKMIPVPPKRAGVMPPNGQSGIVLTRGVHVSSSAPVGIMTQAPKAVSSAVQQCPLSHGNNNNNINNSAAFLQHEKSSSSNNTGNHNHNALDMLPASVLARGPRTSVLSRTGHTHASSPSAIPSSAIQIPPPYSMRAIPSHTERHTEPTNAPNPLFSIPAPLLTSMRSGWNGLMMPEEESNRMLSLCMDVQPIQEPPQSVRREPYIRKIRDPYTLDHQKVQVLLHPNFRPVEERPLAGCRRVAVCGMFHSGNHPLRDYGLLFDEEVQPRRRSNKNRWEADMIFGDNRECNVWKHRIPETDWGMPRDVAVLCCIRDPLFFVPRVIKQPYSIREYDSKATQENGLPRIKQVIEKATVDYEGRTFFHPLTLQAGDNTLSAKDRDHAVDFNNISDVYREYAQGFLSGKMCSGEADDLKRFLIVRLEDVQKRPQEVVEALTRLGLKLLEPEKPFQALEKPAKTGCGTREQLIANNSVDKRYEAWTGCTDLLKIMREDISPALLDSLGYEGIDPERAPSPEVKSSALQAKSTVCPAPVMISLSAHIDASIGAPVGGAAPIHAPIGASVGAAPFHAPGAHVGAVGSAPLVPPPVAPHRVSQASSSASS